MKSLFDLTLDDFTIPIVPPVSRLSGPCVNIYEDGRFNMNGKLAEKLGGKQVSLSFSSDRNHFLLVEGGQNAFPVPKSGSCKLPAVAELLRSNSILFPAKYSVQYLERLGGWVGEHQENPTIKPSGKHRDTKKK